MKTIAAGEFKAKCLSLLDEVNRAHETIVVTKHGIPVARMVPVSREKDGQKGTLRGSVLSEKDLLRPIDDTWEADR